jgi:hypothetical protein
MRKYVLPSVAAALALASAPASAAEIIFNGAGDVGEIEYNGFPPGGSVIDGLTGRLQLSLISVVGNVWTFGYSLINTSTGDNLSSRISSFAFDSDPNVSSATGITGFTGVQTNNTLNGTAFEICFTGSNNNCQGGPGGASVGSPVEGSFSLTFGSSPSSLTLSNFLVRYQSTGANGEGSAIGVGTAVPEPGTWLLMILGLGAVGFAMRRRQTTSVRFQFA